MDFLQDMLAALGVVLNGIPAGLMMMSYGFASIPTGFGFVVGAIACFMLGSAVPISFQAETIALAGTMGKDMKERLSMIFYAGVVMAVLGGTGMLTAIVGLAGNTVISAMMAGVGIMLAKIGFDMTRGNMLVGLISIASAALIYFCMGQNLVYTIVGSVVAGSLAANIAKQDFGGGVTGNVVESFGKLKLQKPIFSWRILRGALALSCLTVGANIAFGSITGSMTASGKANIDQLTLYSGLADVVSSLFGGGPVEAIISATGSAPHPVASGILMMVIMAAILFTGLLPKLGRYVPGESIAGFLVILGAVVTVPGNAAAAFTAVSAGGVVVAGVTMVITAAADPFLGMVAGTVLSYLFAAGIGL